MESPNMGKTNEMQKALDAETETSDFEVVQKNEGDVLEEEYFPTPKMGNSDDTLSSANLGDLDVSSSHATDDSFKSALDITSTFQHENIGELGVSRASSYSPPEDTFQPPNNESTASYTDMANMDVCALSLVPSFDSVSTTESSTSATSILSDIPVLSRHAGTTNFISGEMGMPITLPDFEPAGNFGPGGDDGFGPFYNEMLENTRLPQISPDVEDEEIEVIEPTPSLVVPRPAPVGLNPVPKPIFEPLAPLPELKPKPAPVEQKKVEVKDKADDTSEIKEPMQLFCKMGLDAWFNPERLHPRVGDLVYWRDPKKSGIVFGSGLGILLSLSFFSLISVVAYLSLLSLTATICYRIYKNVLQAVQKTSDGHPFKDILELDLSLPQDKVREVTDIAVAHVNAALLELRRLFLVEDLVDSIKFGVLLWCLTYLGAWFNGMTLIIIAFVAMFTLPKVYENNKSQIDQNLDIVRAKLADISAKVKAAVPIGKKPAVEEKKEQ